MKNKIRAIVLCYGFFVLTISQAQVKGKEQDPKAMENEALPALTDRSLKDFDFKISQIAVEIQNTTVREKEQLRVRVDSINNLVDLDLMTEEEGQKLKSIYAKEASEKIERTAVQMQDSLTLTVQNQVDYAMKSGEYLKIADTRQRGTDILIERPFNYEKKGEKMTSEKRTTFRLSLAYGISNLETEGAFANSEIRYIPSNLIQGGFYLKTRLEKNKSFLYLRYGIGWTYSNLKSTGHRYFTVENGETILVEHEKNLRKARLTVGSIQVPIYLEFDWSKPVIDEKTGKKYFRSEESWRGGIGAFVNVDDKNSKGHQVYRYREDGVEYRVDEKGNLGINRVRYGVGAYFGYRAWSLQFQYELTPLFKHNSIKQNIWSCAIRMDI